MSQLVADCPRCGANKITFDLASAIITRIEHGWQNWYEAFSICRQCQRSSVFVLSESVNGNYTLVHEKGLLKIEGAVNRFVNIDGIISLKDRVAVEPPEFVPSEVEAIFREGAVCMAVGCYNAAGTMFRLSIDLVTRGMLPAGDAEGLNHRTKRDLGLRLRWLFENETLPNALRELSTCVREDGNDGAHAGNLSKDDAADLLDFTRLLLERLYTEPERLRVAEERRRRRRESDA